MAESPVGVRILRGAKIGLLTGCITAVLSLFIPNRYRSEAKILPAEQRVVGGSISQLAAAAGLSLPAQEGSDASYQDILASRWLRESLLNTKFKYSSQHWLYGKPHAHEETLFDYLGQRNIDRALVKMNEILSSNRDLKTKLLTISVETKSPELSAEVADKAVELLEQFLKEKNQTRGSNKASFATARLSESKKMLENVEREFRQFAEANKNYLSSSEPSIRLRGNRLESELRLQQQLVLTLAVNKEQALMEEKNDIPVVTILDLPSVPCEKSSPHRLVMIFVGFLLGAVLSIGYESRTDWTEWYSARMGA